MKELFQIFLVFAKIGVTTLGGGYAMLPILQRELVENRGWATEEEIADYYAIGQCTPGIIAVNTATFIGFKKKGVSGGIVATIGVIFPSIIIISAIASFLQGFADVPLVQNAFSGIRVAVCVLILNAVMNLFKKSVIDIKTAVIFAVVFVLSAALKIKPPLLVIAAGCAGAIIKALGENKACG